ncbi:MAG: hypothetical protein LBR80_14365 [Deltaproteobacteria bacterium]|nr:hypothetical protein [Deltaproteobacteria bacterium]
MLFFLDCFYGFLFMAVDDGMLENCEELFIDGTKLKANAWRHRVYPFKKAGEKVEKWTSEIGGIMERMGDDGVLNALIQKEIDIRLNKIAFVSDACEKIEGLFNSAREEHAAEYERIMEERSRVVEAGGKPRGKAPSPLRTSPSPPPS